MRQKVWNIGILKKGQKKFGSCVIGKWEQTFWKGSLKKLKETEKVETGREDSGYKN